MKTRVAKKSLLLAFALIVPFLGTQVVVAHADQLMEATAIGAAGGDSSAGAMIAMPNSSGSQQVTTNGGTDCGDPSACAMQAQPDDSYDWWGF